MGKIPVISIFFYHIPYLVKGKLNHSAKPNFLSANQFGLVQKVIFSCKEIKYVSGNSPVYCVECLFTSADITLKGFLLRMDSNVDPQTV